MQAYKIVTSTRRTHVVTVNAESHKAAVEAAYPEAGVWLDHISMTEPEVKFYTVDLIGRPNFVVAAVPLEYTPLM